jgi:hypothetical protein
MEDAYRLYRAILVMWTDIVSPVHPKISAKQEQDDASRKWP